MEPLCGYTSPKVGPRIGRLHWKLGYELGLEEETCAGPRENSSYGGQALGDPGQEEYIRIASVGISVGVGAPAQLDATLTGKDDDPSPTRNRIRVLSQIHTPL